MSFFGAPNGLIFAIFNSVCALYLMKDIYEGSRIEGATSSIPIPVAIVHFIHFNCLFIAYFFWTNLENIIENIIFDRNYRNGIVDRLFRYPNFFVWFETFCQFLGPFIFTYTIYLCWIVIRSYWDGTEWERGSNIPGLSRTRTNIASLGRTQTLNTFNRSNTSITPFQGEGRAL